MGEREYLKIWKLVLLGLNVIAILEVVVHAKRVDLLMESLEIVSLEVESAEAILEGDPIFVQFE